MRGWLRPTLGCYGFWWHISTVRKATPTKTKMGSPPKKKGCLVCRDSLASAMKLSWVDPRKQHVAHFSIASSGRGAPECKLFKIYVGHFDLIHVCFMNGRVRSMKKCFDVLACGRTDFLCVLGLARGRWLFPKLVWQSILHQNYLSTVWADLVLKTVVEWTHRDTVSEPHQKLTRT